MNRASAAEFKQKSGKIRHTRALGCVLLAELLLAFALILGDELDSADEEPFSP